MFWCVFYFVFIRTRVRNDKMLIIKGVECYDHFTPKTKKLITGTAFPVTKLIIFEALALCESVLCIFFSSGSASHNLERKEKGRKNVSY